MVTFDEKEVKFMQQFNGTDLQVILKREKNAFYEGAIYNRDQETRTLLRGAAQALDAILEAMSNKSIGKDE